ncbi:hypothetical protein SAMN05216559_2292 [Halomicrobium zhouii]|uniref:DUF7692 domain-containing protein n=1 Tax=Halomicrobium zhouii TaxID=767519 RepID=A0A1I6L9R3_9EURY|nr:hypothetical protein [Halomicrobium zhouii]SFR99990.1 hypothetical protein SAMN05216559_2292 [Halomicrobium zhouii]
MRIRTDGKHARREDTIDEAAEFWSCNKTTALVKSAEFTVRIDQRIQKVLARDDLTTVQRREIAETLTVPSYYEIDVSQAVDVEK